jgi:hypothetical protein
MEEASYKNKYKELKRKFKALQSVSCMQEHVKLLSQLESTTKAVQTLMREKA